MLKNTINIILCSASLCLCVILILIGVAGSHRHLAASKCSALEVELTDSSTRQFITAAGVKKIIDKEYGGYINVPAGQISLKKIEDILEKEGILETHEAYFTPDAVLHVRVKQCTPLLRISSGSGTWYVCKGDRWFRVKDDWCRDIPTLQGNARTADSTWMSRVGALGEYLMEHDSKAGAVKKMSTDSKGDISIRFDGRDEEFQIGQPCALKQKFAKVDTYVGMMERNEEKKYRTVKVQYDKQIVCR